MLLYTITVSVERIRLPNVYVQTSSIHSPVCNSYVQWLGKTTVCFSTQQEGILLQHELMGADGPDIRWYVQCPHQIHHD